ncbi:MAG TPA: energy transducer TonB [Acidobacteriota bacterium]|nr:energy transducer TonB [Acidobacteriota bacterium]
MKLFKSLFGVWLITFILSTSSEAAPENQYLFLSDQRIITLEFIDDKTVIVNYIHLGDTFDLLLARNLVFLDAEQSAYRGHLFELEGVEGEQKQFDVSDLIEPGEFSGFVIVGDFKFRSPPVTPTLKIAGKIFELEPLSGEEFEIVVARIGELNLKANDKTEAIRRAGFGRGFGRFHLIGSDSAAEFERYFKDEDIVPPLALETPPPRLPSSESSRPDPVFVKIKAYVSRAGGLRNLEVVQGLDKKLDQIALDTVQNSWRFLPAISGNEVAEAEVTLNVVFKRQ